MSMATAMMQLMGTFSKVKDEVDVEAIELLVKFINRAVETGDPKSFLKEVLRTVVDAPDSPTTQKVEVKLLPRKSSARR